MRTKIVYVLVSDDKDIYTEQLYMSAWSCIHFNPSAEIIVLADSDSQRRIESYPQLQELVLEINYQYFHESYTKIERSRILKTRIPEYVEGPFLYIDVDTIINGSIVELDKVHTEISLVEDRHVKYYSQTGMLKKIMTKSYSFYGRLPRLNAKYYNGGVLLCQNNSKGKEFFERWHENWCQYIKASTDFLDQTALFETTENYREIVRPLGNHYNVQVGAYKNRYKQHGKILHFYNSSVGYYKDLHPFFDKKYYKQIKNDKILSDRVKTDIVNCKEYFNYNFYNKKFKYIPGIIIDLYRHLRWRIFYNLTRPITYAFVRSSLRTRKSQKGK